MQIQLNLAARNTAIAAFCQAYATAQLRIMRDATVLATHTLNGFGTPVDGVITAAPIANATVANGGVANRAMLVAGDNQLTLTVGTSDAHVNMNNLTLVAGGTSIVNSVTMNVPAGG